MASRELKQAVSGPKPVRVQLSRAKGWRMPPNTVRVARPSQWGNPFKIGGFVRDFRGGMPAKINDAEMAVRLFSSQFYECVATDMAVRAIQSELRGKNLACWCKPGAPCHADVLLEIANADTSSETVTNPGRGQID